MNDFYFHLNTKFRYGRGTVAGIAEEILNYGTKVFFIYDEIPAKATGAYELIHKVCGEKGITVTDFTGIEPNPRHSTIDRARALLKETGADVVVALGGGSTIDSGKALCLTANYEGSCWEVFEAAAKLEPLSTQGKKEEGVLPLITIPTIAASGSEASNVAVIANHDKNMKLDYRSDALRPVAVFTDPTYTYTVPPFQTACGILDIMSHSYEGYFSSSAGSMQDGISETIQRTCVEHGKKIMLVPHAYESRAQLLWAAQLSIAHLSDQGRNFVGNIHATERVVGNYFGFPHGSGIAIISLAWFKYALNDQTVNPIGMRLGQYPLTRAVRPKKVLIVGGGVGGMETARIAAMRGHSVTLAERSDILGGRLFDAGVHKFKQDIRDLAKWYDRELEELGVEVKPGREMTPEDIRASGADAVILSVGADAVMPGRIPGIDHPKSVSCTDVLSGKKKVGQKVAIIGAGLVGAEMAHDMAKEEGKEVVLVDGLDDILANDPDGVPFQTRWMLNELLYLHGVKKYMGHMLDSINDQGCVLKNKAGEPVQIEADDVIIAIGFRARKSMYEELYGIDIEVYEIVAGNGIGSIASQVNAAYEIARNL